MLNYAPCGRVEVGKDTVIIQYMWQLLDCQPARISLQQQTEILHYQFVDTALSMREGARLFIVDQWTAASDFIAGDYNLSYQLLTDDWDNVAQLDLPLDDSDQLRMYYIDVSHVDPGNYRLMLILYHAQTGERAAWLGKLDSVSNMLQLSEIEIR